MSRKLFYSAGLIALSTCMMVPFEVKSDEYLAGLNQNVAVVKETETEYDIEAEVMAVKKRIKEIESAEITEATGVSKEERDLIALVTMAEAEGECEEGKRLVIDTILNRVDSEHFPDTITDVIYQKDQFESMWNGRVDKCYVDENIYKLVCEELQSRTNYDVMFFTAGRYGNYGTPMFQVENHYFSSYE